MKSQRTAVEYLISKLNAYEKKHGSEAAIKKVNEYYKPIAKAIERHQIYKAFCKEELDQNWFDYYDSLIQKDI